MSSTTGQSNQPAPYLLRIFVVPPSFEGTFIRSKYDFEKKNIRRKEQEEVRLYTLYSLLIFVLYYYKQEH